MPILPGGGSSGGLAGWTELTDSTFTGSLQNDSGSSMVTAAYQGGGFWRFTPTTSDNTVYNGISEVPYFAAPFEDIFGSGFDSAEEAAQIRIELLQFSGGTIRQNRWGIGAGIRQESDDEGLGFAIYDAASNIAWFWVDDPLAPSLTNALTVGSVLANAPTEMVTAFGWDNSNVLRGAGLWNATIDNGGGATAATYDGTTNASISETPSDLEVFIFPFHPNTGAAAADQHFDFRVYSRVVPLETWFIT